MARRGRGEGTIRHRSDGRWEATVTLGVARKSFYGKTRREVTDKLRAAQRDYEQSEFVGDDRQTVEQYLASWLETKRPELAASTHAGYESKVRLYINPVIGKVRLSRLTAQQVQRVMTSCVERGLAGKSANEVYGVLHQALDAAERLGLVARNVSGLVQRPRGKTREMRPLSREEVNRFLTAARGHLFEAFFRLALSTGMRRGEMLALKWREVDLTSSRLSVVASMNWLHGEMVYSRPKTKRSRRQIALAPEMVDVLRALRIQQRAQRLRVGAAWQGDQYDAVFTDELGIPLHPSRVTYQLRVLLRQAGVPEIRIHDLRHTCATLLLASRVHPKVVSELLGHSTVAMTLDVYSHVLPDMQEDAARAMSAGLNW
jgi:integrase